MPLHNRRDSKGPYFIWGERGKKYYYKANSKLSKSRAKSKAMKQARAIESSSHNSNDRI